jgi:hypothetical protein
LISTKPKVGKAVKKMAQDLLTGIKQVNTAPDHPWATPLLSTELNL